ncbi:MAG: zinc-ribbon domain-containing protein [gamma proteobacterium symbiont of Taylorina sp.]|nr:zinc-ribbon domain-containing protein [gamma proteobacterium symbiont of Taylorina sp.]
MFTNCPHCKTHFAVTQEALEIADGMVRCGQCNQVFNAAEHLTESMEAPEVKESFQVENSLAVEDSIPVEDSFPIEDSIPPENSTSTEDELELIDYEDNHKEIEDSFSSELTDDNNAHKVDPLDIDIYNSLTDETEEDSSSLASETNLSLDDALLDSDFNDELEESSEDINRTLDDQLKDFEIKEPDITEKTDLSFNSDLTETSEENEYSLDENISNAAKNIDHLLGIQSTDETEDFDSLDSGDDLSAQLDQLEANYNNSATDNSSLSVDDPLSVDDFSNIDESIVLKDTSLPERKIASSSAKGTSSNNSDDEPAYFKQSNFIRQSSAVLFSWLAGCIILALILGTQYLHFNSSYLAQDKTFRPFLEILCPISQCELPLLKATHQIVTVEHDIYSHKKYKDALEVRLTFKNKASAAQAYPVLEIVFSNPLGAEIAQRRFLPDEYLNDKSQLSQGMKPNQSQTIKLDIIDPDPSALLSFQFNYL